MSLSHRYRQLAALIETLESQGISVQQAEPLGEGGSDQSSDGGFAVQLCIELPADATVRSPALDRLGRSRPSVVPSTEPIGTPTGPIGIKPPAPGSKAGIGGDQLADAGDVTTSHDDTRDAVEADDGGGDDVRDTAPEADDIETESRDPDSDDVAVADAETVDDGSEVGDVSGADEASDGEDTAVVGDTSGTDGLPETEDAPGDATESTAGGGDEASDQTADDAVACTHPDCDRTFDTARGMKIHRTKAHPLSEHVDGERERTVHRDPAILARVYEEHDTFAEMTEALDVDVGAQAVRKQMIRHGIHEPGARRSNGDTTAEREDDDRARDRSASTASEPGGDEAGERDDVSDASLDDDTPVADRLPDLDLPGSLSTDDLLTAVEEANTLYDVQRALDLDRETTQDVLGEYDLLELVSGRAAAVGDREDLKAEIGQRIRRAAT